MNIPLPNEIYGGLNLSLDSINKRIHIFIGPNGSGKSKLVQKIKDTIGAHLVKIVANNINNISGINAIDEEQAKIDSLRNNDVSDIVSLINANETLRKIIFHWFERLFGKKLSKQGNAYQIDEGAFTYTLNADGDGYRTFFNLVYYLTAPEYKNIVFDEPERYLHPNLQISLFNMVKKLSKDYDKRIFFITHNPNFIDLLSDDIEIILLNKKRQQVHNITEIINSTANAHFRTWIHYNKHILFSTAIVLLEGYSDQLLLNHLMSKLNHSAFARNITFASVAVMKDHGGKSRMPEYQAIISQFFECWCLFDLDLLLDSGGELGKYVTNAAVLSAFKSDLTANGIGNKASLKTFISNPINNKTFLFQMLDDLKANHKVLTLTKGEMEDYCLTIGAHKLSEKLYDEIDHITVTPQATIESEYSDLIKAFEKVDNLGSLSSSDFENLIFQFVSRFYTEFYAMTPYNWAKISADLRNHISSDPNAGLDGNFRFRFRFLSDKHFTIPKETTDPNKKHLISTTLNS